MDWMLMPLRRYADFSGRSRRKEYWMFQLGLIIASIAMVAVVAVIGGGMGDMADGGGPLAGIGLMIFGVFILAIIIPSIAVQVRRFHDQDKSGWLVLLNLIPYLGGLIVFVFMFLEGTAGPNRFGPDPKAGERGDSSLGYNGPNGPRDPDRI
jgi:uncharacterized membrane protein YhaH (DUF805 family)